ncbi:Hypothetical protein A7982_06360 [Minicystis rosea]|nr:Hypothetical protein A7982_06360 [Minicystis rosea]
MVAVAGCDDASKTSATTGAAPTASSTAALTASAASDAPSASASAVPTADPAAAAEEEEAGKHLRHHHRHHHHGGVAMFIHMALDTLGLPDEKKAQVEKIQGELREKTASSREAGRNVLTILADGVAAGKIDNAKLDAAIAKQEAAAAAVHDGTAAALNQLHAALSPAERAALVEKVQAHISVWKKVTHEEAEGSKEKHSRLDHLATQLSLTPEQVDKISEALKKDAPAAAPDAAALDTHIKAFETAFVAETFDAKTLATAKAASTHVSKHGTARTARFYKIVTPLLTPEQRTKLAEHLRERLTDPHAAK